MIKVEGLHELGTLLLSNLSVTGPGLEIGLFLFKQRREGVKEPEFRNLVRTLRLAGVVEQVGQYLWLTKKGDTLAKANKTPRNL